MGFAILFIWCAMILGMFGNDLRRWNLELRGFAFSELVLAKNIELALAKYFEKSPEIARNFLLNESQL